MISVILLLLVIVSGSVFCATYFDEPFEKTIPISIMWITFILLIAGVLNALLYGVYFITGVSVILYASVAVYAVRKGIVSVCRKIITGALLAFSLFFVISIFANRGMQPHEWDEFSYWMLAAKTLCVNDALYTRTHEEMITGYPQGVAAIQYLFSRWTMLWRKTDIFPAGMAYVALQVTQISFAFPLIKKEHKNGFLSWFILLLILFCFPIFFFTNFYSVIVPDALLGIVIGAGIATVAFTPENEKNIFYHILILSECAFLVLTKRTGFALAMALAGSYIIDAAYTSWHEQNGKWKRIVSSALASGMSVIIPFAFFRAETQQDEEARALLYIRNDDTNVFNIITDGMDKKINATKAFFEQFFYETFTVGHTGIKIPFYLLILICGILIYILYLEYDHFGINGKNRIVLFGAYSYLVFIAWMFAFLYSYLFTFSDFEANNVSSFGRYLTSGFMPIVYILICGFGDIVRFMSGRRERLIKLIIIVILCTIIPMAEPLRFINGRYLEEASESMKNIEKLISLVSETDFGKTDRLFYISQSDYGNRRNKICYYAYPTKVSKGPWCFTDGKYDSEDDYQENKMFFASTKNAQELLEQWEKEGVTYVLIQDTDDYFIENFSSLFAAGEPEDDSLYVFDAQEGQLVKVK